MGLLPAGLRRYITDIFVNGTQEASFDHMRDAEYHIDANAVGERQSFTFTSNWSSNLGGNSDIFASTAGTPIDIDNSPFDLDYRVTAGTGFWAESQPFYVYENGNEIYEGNMANDQDYSGSINAGESVRVTAWSEDDDENPGVGGIYELTFYWPKQTNTNPTSVTFNEL